MSGEHIYLYAITFSSDPCRRHGVGVDPRFPVYLVYFEQLAAVCSRVGLDQFDVSRFQAENQQDAEWLSRVAVRHDEVVMAASTRPPVIPLRLGAIFRSHKSMVARIWEQRSAVMERLMHLGKRQEWAVKLFLHKPPASELSPQSTDASLSSVQGSQTGAQYLKRKRVEYQRQCDSRSSLKQELLRVKATLSQLADEHSSVPVPPAGLTDHREKMVWNGAFLVSPANTERWLALVEKTRRAVLPRGLAIEAKGPWPPYHFCSALDLEAA